MASEPKDDSTEKDAPPSASTAPRPLTIDDVPRLGSGSGVAIGCTVVVVVAIVLFWLLRGWLMHLG
jgi:hypothetical protein